MDIEGLGIAGGGEPGERGAGEDPRRPVLPEGRRTWPSWSGMGKKSAENLMAAIQRSKEQDLSRLIYAFGIRQVGQKAGKVLAARFGTLEALENATLEGAHRRGRHRGDHRPERPGVDGQPPEPAPDGPAAGGRGEYRRRGEGGGPALCGDDLRADRRPGAPHPGGGGGHDRGPGGQSGLPPCPRRPPMWWRGRLPAPSCARPRSWASRCSARRNFSGSWSEWRASRAFGELDRLDWSGGASALPLGVSPEEGRGRGRRARPRPAWR